VTDEHERTRAAREATEDADAPTADKQVAEDEAPPATEDGPKEKVTTGGAPTPGDTELPAESDEADRLAQPPLPPAHPTRRGMFGPEDGAGDTSGYGRLVVRDTNPVRGPSTPRPWADEFEALHDDVTSALATAGLGDDDGPFEKVVVDRGQLTFFVKREKLAEVARMFRDDAALRFEMCDGLNGVHYPDETGRELHVVYQLLSITHNRRVNLEVVCPDADPHVPSVVHTYPSANWHERETYDFFGVIFDGHPALTRIEMPDDWPGHPQRKDYPLGGIPVEYKGATIAPPDERRAYN
jgi:NADH-quinone oxidoreductase subunit C